MINESNNVNRFDNKYEKNKHSNVNKALIIKHKKELNQENKKMNMKSLPKDKLERFTPIERNDPSKTLSNAYMKIIKMLKKGFGQLQQEEINEKGCRNSLLKTITVEIQKQNEDNCSNDAPAKKIRQQKTNKSKNQTSHHIINIHDEIMKADSSKLSLVNDLSNTNNINNLNKNNDNKNCYETFFLDKEKEKEKFSFSPQLINNKHSNFRKNGHFTGRTFSQSSAKDKKSNEKIETTDTKGNFSKRGILRIKKEECLSQDKPISRKRIEKNLDRELSKSFSIKKRNRMSFDILEITKHDTVRETRNDFIKKELIKKEPSKDFKKEITKKDSKSVIFIEPKRKESRRKKFRKTVSLNTYVKIKSTNSLKSKKNMVLFYHV